MSDKLKTAETFYERIAIAKQVSCEFCNGDGRLEPEGSDLNAVYPCPNCLRKRRVSRTLTGIGYDSWNLVHGLMLRLHLLECLYCNNTGDGCDCGADGVPYEVSGGNHYKFCMFYNGCRMCGRTAK